MALTVPGFTNCSGLSVTRQENVTDTVLPPMSVTVTVGVRVSTVVGTPEMRPVDVLIDRPAGRPVADHTSGRRPPVTVRVCETAVSVWLVLVAGTGMASGWATVHVKLTSSVRPSRSRTSTMTEYEPGAVKLPVMRPVSDARLRPVGRPVADQTRGSVPPETRSLMLTTSPTYPDWFPTAAIVGGGRFRSKTGSDPGLTSVEAT